MNVCSLTRKMAPRARLKQYVKYQPGYIGRSKPCHLKSCRPTFVAHQDACRTRLLIPKFRSSLCFLNMTPAILLRDSRS